MNQVAKVTPNEVLHLVAYAAAHQRDKVIAEMPGQSPSFVIADRKAVMQAIDGCVGRLVYSQDVLHGLVLDDKARWYALDGSVFDLTGILLVQVSTTSIRFLVTDGASLSNLIRVAP
jgi:hypothetical protein